MYNQIIASTNNKGMEAKMPPIKELFFDASETTTINKAKKNYFNNILKHIKSPCQIYDKELEV